MEKDKAKVVVEEDLMTRAKSRFKTAWDAFNEAYEQMLSDLNFVNGDQWPEAIKTARAQDDRPCLRINKLPQFVDKVVGEMRQSRPSIKIRPVDDKADDDTADVMSGIVRNIETQSDAEIVYDSGGEAMVRCGFGVWRVRNDYVDNQSFDQHLLIERVQNQFSALFDPAARKWDRSDGRFGFLYEDLPREVYENTYPDAPACPWSGGGKDLDNWIKEKTIRVVEYWEKEQESKEIYQISIQGENGTKIVYELPEEAVNYNILRQRTITSDKIVWYRLCGNGIIEGPTDVPGKLIPLVPVYGKEINIAGKSNYYGIVRHAKDSMRLYNYFRSMDAETIALAPKAPWLMTAKMLGPYREKWGQAHKRNFPYLLYVPDPDAPTARPERTIPQMSNQAIIQNTMVADQELHDTTGLQLASLGKKSNEQSGRAIEARAKEGDIGQFTYVDNQVRAIKLTAKIIVGMIPYIYDGDRVQRIIGEDGAVKNVQINARFEDEKDGKTKIFDLTAGRYDVVASVGPSYETQRQESLSAMLDFLQLLDPPQRAVVVDKIAETSDWHGKDELAARLRKLLPDGIAEPEEGEEPEAPDQAELQAQALQQAQIEAEQEKLEVELAIKKAEKIKAEAEAAKAEAEAAIAEAEAAAIASGRKPVKGAE